MKRKRKFLLVLSICSALLFLTGANICAKDIYVSQSGSDSDSGTFDQPFKTVTKGLSTTEPGDTVYIRQGNYDEFISFPVAGTASNRITLKAYNKESVTVTQSGQVIQIDQPYITVEDIVFDGDWGEGDTVKLKDKANYCILKGLEVKNSMRDTVDLDTPEGVLIEDCIIHDAILFKDGDRDDAHGIVTGGVKDLTIRNTEIYYVSGDTLQFQYGGWDNITVENCVLWNAPLPSARGGAPKGVYPGENAVDTKHYTDSGRGRLFIKDTVAYGWRSDYINNASAFNIKQSVEVDFDGVTVYDSEIAFRLRGAADSRGGALVTLKNAVIYDSDKAVRYEDDIENLHVYNATFGRELAEQFESAGGHGSGFQVKNCLFLSGSKPDEASDDSNMAVDTSAFVNSSSDDYHLATGSPAIDKGVTIAEVTADRDGLTRPAGDAYDIGAYESEGEGPTPSDSLCDVETHGNITLCTVINTLRICSGLTVDKKYLMDIDKDGKINMADAIYALQALAEMRD
ncbi:MAG: DUF1565 domain-containing protein [Desulfobacterales bacterium]|nr:DUF1565 domain-containing protein [Desulfobacterales bacterium]